MPRLGERRNVYWDAATVRTLDGRRLPDMGGWMPEDVPARSAPRGPAEVVLAGHRVKRVSVDSLPSAPLRGRRLAIVVDRSYSMGRVREPLLQALRTIRDLSADNEVDYYLGASAVRGEPPARLDHRFPDIDQLVFYGGEKTNDLLRQFQSLRAGRDYDAVLVLTDDGSFDLAADGGARIDAGAPVWMVHLGGRLPAGYDDATGDSLWRRGGGITLELDDALRALALAHAGAPIVSPIVSIDGDFAWTVEPTADADSGGNDPMTPLAARQLAIHQSRLAREGDRAALDRVHSLAALHGIVTPFSSMIVLVDERQRAELRAAEARDDRFEREVETGKHPLSQPANVFHVEGTPEPEEWLLMLLAAAALAAALLQRRRAALA
jgi:putative PEP-CTERM system integral membrane protein